MEWTWFQRLQHATVSLQTRIERHVSAEGFLYRTSTPHNDPFWMSNPFGFGPFSGLASLLAQLEESGLAHAVGNDLLLPWASIYGIRNQTYFGIEALELPAERPIAPVLGYENSFADPSFAIRIEGWLTEDGLSLQSDPIITGALAKVDGNEYLLTESCWKLLSEIRSFQSLAPNQKSPDANRRAWSSIRRHAVSSKASLADFLQQTVVLTPDKLRLGLRKAEFAQTKMVEINPSFEGAPDGWLRLFDLSKDVRDRYDIPAGEGMIQVLVEPSVKRVLQEIKRMPGRRVAGARAEAFITNPFSALGEDAGHVIDESEFEKARLEAGLSFQRFSVDIKEDAYGFPEKVALVIEEAGNHDISSERHEFNDVSELENFVACLQKAIQSEHQLLAWHGHDFEILGDSADHFKSLNNALSAWKSPKISVRYADVHDISRYSERISGIGVEKPYYSPFIAKKDDGDGWFPENVHFGLWFKAEGESEPVAITLSKDQLATFEKKIAETEQLNLNSFSFPGCPKAIPLAEAKAIAESFKEVFADVKSQKFQPDKKLDDQHSIRSSDRKTLVLKANVNAVDYQEARLEALRVDRDRGPVLPSVLKNDVELKEHQKIGVAWLQHLWSNAPKYCRGAMLADDMGLGKTIQLLTFIAYCHEQDPELDPALVVAPVSLLENWKEEIQKFFAPHSLPVLTLYGSSLQDRRLKPSQVDEELLKEGISKFLVPGWSKGAKIVLTTYETLRDLEFSLASQPWSIMVCDEAQRIKNPNAMVTRAAKKQKVRFRIACTGTPVENTLADLWCLFDFIQPGLLGALNDFGTRYRKPIEAKTDEDKARVDELRALIEPQILRRMKTDVAKDLPKKHDRRESLQISHKQRLLYGNAINMFRSQGENAAPQFKNHLGLLHYLRRICTDPRPLGHHATIIDPFDKYASEAPKLEWLIRTLESIRQRGEKCIIFIEFRDIQRLVQHYIHDRLKISPDIINGDTETAVSHSNSRHKRISAFQKSDGFNVIVLSPLAVGFGVNIQAANHVIHYTRTWNPAKEDQATDRAYRIGQQREVFVYYPVVEAPEFKTFDCKLDELLRRKRELSTDMLNGCGDLNPREFGNLDNIDGTEAFNDDPLTRVDVASMTPDTFECFCALLWSKQNYQKVFRTPKSGDGGIDVVAIRGTEGALIQCKSSSNHGAKLGWDGVKDVVAGQAAYKSKFPKVTFRRVAVTNQFFNGHAEYQAHENGVELVDQNAICELLAQFPVRRLELEQSLAFS